MNKESKISCAVCGPLGIDKNGNLLHPAREKEIKKNFFHIIEGREKFKHTERSVSDKKV